MNDKRLDTPIQYLKGVGPKLAKVLKKVGLETVEDILYFVHREYEDRTQIVPLGKVQPADFVIVKGLVASVNNQNTRGRFSVLQVRLEDRSGYIEAARVNQAYQSGLFSHGMKLIVSGRV